MSDKKEPKFEDALQKMEEIVDQLESGELSLDESLKLYEEGVKMSQSCSKRLDEAQKKIEILVRNSAGDLETEPADANLKTKKSKKK